MKRNLLQWVVLIALFCVLMPKALGSANGQAATPPMGWSSWNHYGCGINESLIEQAANAMVSTGMKAAGYQYVNLDDCWMATSRDSNGNLIPDPTAFPSGMPALVSYVHGLGLKIGVYEDVGTATCEGRPGSYGHYDQDAATFAARGIDYVKMDWCNTGGLDPSTQYVQFSQALTQASGNILFSVCNWGVNQPWSWAPNVANSWRTTPDIADTWSSVINNMDATSALAFAADPGAWNDPDLLEVGNGGMTDIEDQTHFSMWAMLAAPLIAGNDLNAMSAATTSTLTNAEVIAVDQDPLGKQGTLISDDGTGLQVWTRQITNATAVALLNRTSAEAPITVNWSDLGLAPAQSVSVRDLWAKADLGSFSNSFSATVPPHGVTLVKVGAIGDAPAQTVYEADAAANMLGGAAMKASCPNVSGFSCLDGSDIQWLGNGAANSVTFNNVSASSEGNYYLTIYGAVKGTRTFDVSVNGSTSTAVNVSGTSYSIPSTAGLTVPLNAGANTIAFSNPNAYAPDLDHIVLTPQGSVASAASGPAVSLSTTSLSFGEETIGSATSSQSVSLTNSGNAPLNISGIAVTGANASAFTFANSCGTNLAAGASCTIHGHFMATALGPMTAAIRVTDNAPFSPQWIALSGTGESLSKVSLSAASLSFASEKLGATSGSESATLTNPGTGRLAISSINMIGLDSSSFTFSNSCGTALVADASCTVHGHFSPIAVGALTATIAIADNATGSPHTIALSGTGLGPVVTLSPANLSFGYVNPGSSSASQSVALTNTGTMPLAISSVVVTGANASSFMFSSGCGSSVAVGAGCTIHGHFSPSAAGAMTASINITDNAVGSPQTIPISGAGEGPLAVSLSSSSLSFGSAPVGSTTVSQSVSLTNTGATPLTISSIIVAGANAPSFVFGNSCGTKVAAGASCSIHGHFGPTAPGARTASIIITDNAAGSPQSVALSGTGQ